MTTAPKPIRIAIVLNGQEFICHAVTLPFSLEGYPPVELVLYGTTSEVAAGCQVNPLPDLDPGGFDLILDGQFMTAGMTDFSPEKADHLITGPVARFLKTLVCQLQELRQKQEINSRIINSANDAIITINEDHVIVGYNRGAEEMFGYTRSEALGQDLTIIIPPPYKAEHRTYVRRYVATREARMIGKHARLNALRRDGREFPISISFSVAEIHDNLYFTGIIRDITEYKEMEDRVLHTERLAAVGNTMTHIAHEIKNPLLIIGGFARQLLKVPALDDKSRHKLSIIAEEVGQLEAMVAEMREFVRRPPAVKRPGQIGDALTAALELFYDTFRERHIQVRRVEETPLPAIAFDPQQVHQVLINLLKNALEAMPGGGEITITSRVTGANAEISVRDTGVGLAPEVAAKIFQPYFTTKEKGTGLGLANCQSIIAEHGGDIRVASAPGQGTTFTIQLPLETAPPAEG
jgi:two-component system sensor kinase FixL